MQISLVAASGPIPRWQQRLASRLAERGDRVGWLRVEAPPPLSAAVSLLLRFEALLYRLPRPGLAGLAETEGDLPAPDGSPDILIDLAGGEPRPGALRLHVDGSPEPEALPAALLSRHAPELTVVRDGRVLARGRPALENRDILTIGLDQALERAVELLVRAVSAARAGEPGEAAAGPGREHASSTAGFLLSALAGKALARLARRGETWNIGWRRLADADGPAPADLGVESYRWLPRDPTRFLADPFVWEEGGETVILCEEFPFATGRGVISAVTLGPDGRPGAPRVVLERPYHLSYPFLIRDAGQIWMIPETSANRTVELYRAESFPDRWVLEAVLLSDICAADATVTRIAGTWWMFATTTGPFGSSWDALSLFSAPDLRGPWTAHPGNPVLIDASAARPAGSMWRSGDALWRVAQDCRTRYGAGLALCRVDRLDAGGFAQTVDARLAPPPAWSALGCHTFNRSARHAVIDAVWPLGVHPGAGPGSA